MNKLSKNHSRFTQGIVVIALALWAAGSGAQSYSYVTTAMVGYVQVSGARAGVTAWKKKDGSAFPNCTTQPTHMWIDTVGVTEESAKSMLAVLLTAKASEQTVTVYYSVNGSGSCVMSHVAVD